ncbi:MAG TPA: glycosyltransferase family 39 protein [Candidatus Baltobacteraceae bacterium]|jgi:membrane-associated phospholipid phosphatase|nr:glycosyltransferase family 39 protein [Candidatus Baltobacteraceae bacterium]
MIGWLQSLDVSLFRFINSSLSNSFFDQLMPFMSDSPWLACIFILICMWLLFQGGARGRICVLMLVLALCFGNWMVVDTLKNVVGRLRPFRVLSGVHLRTGMGDSFSMPSSHAANWFSATLILFIYYRRSIWAMLPLALLVCFSRVYTGVHYPSDALAGAILGAGYSVAVIFGFDALWQTIGARWFPAWHARLPSLLHPSFTGVKSPDQTEWLRLGYVFIAICLVLRLAYIHSGKIELSEDEAYQWLWSKHPALSYYSKPPLIAYTQFVGTHLWGDTEFGVRFFSPVIAAVLSLLMLRFLNRQAGARLAVVVVLAMTVTPLTALGATVMTVDPLSVLFWTAAMIAGWRAAQPEGTTRQWLWVGLWMGLGFLSKYTNLAQCVCWAVFFLLWPPARRHLRRPGPYLALLIAALFTLPVVIWNAQHHWITVVHVASDGQLGEAWHRTYVVEFLLTEAALLNPLFFIAALWAAAAFWRRGRRDPLSLYFFSMGAPLFLGYFILSWHSRILANWIAPAIIPLFCLAAIYWWKRWEEGGRALKPLLNIGLVFGALVVVILHEPNLVNKVLHRKLPAKLDLLRRVRGWKELARVAGDARSRLEQQDGAPAFILCEHYGFTSQISFYLPEAKSRVCSNPLVFFEAAGFPQNQFYFWPSYLDRKGQDALFVRQVDPPALRPDWLSRWWRHDDNILVLDKPPASPLPAEIERQFESFTDLGIRDIVADGNIVRRVQLIECHHLR